MRSHASRRQLVEIEFVSPGDDQRANQRDAGNRVCCRHQRSMEQRRHARNHLVTQKRRQSKDVKRRYQHLRVHHFSNRGLSLNGKYEQWTHRSLLRP